MRKILVTGGAGFIGSHLTDNMIQQGDFVTVLDNFDPYYSPIDKMNNLKNVSHKRNFHLIKGNILNKSLLENIIRNFSPEYVIHLAAKVGVRNSLKKPTEYEKVNVLGTINLLEAVKKIKIKSFILASSSSVYGDNDEIPFKEDHSVNHQLSPYAITKRTAEIYCKLYSSLYKIPVTILRFFTVYGPRQRPDMAISIFADKVIRKKPVVIFGNGEAKRDFIFISDIVSGINNALLKQSTFTIFNLGYSKPISINSVITCLEKILGSKAEKHHIKAIRSDMKITYADINKANKHLGWVPKVDLRMGLNQTFGNRKQLNNDSN